MNPNVAEAETLDRSVFERTASLLPPRAVSCHLRALAEQARSLLAGLAGADGRDRVGLADAAHAIAGSAGLFGFRRLAAMGPCFEAALRADADDAAAWADALAAALVSTLGEIERQLAAETA